MTQPSFILFDTAIGCCGIAWSERGVIGVQLPEASEERTRTRLLRRFPDARAAPAPAAITRAIEDIVALLRGEARDLSAVAIDLDSLDEFDRRVCLAARAIPAGATLTYGELATRLGDRSLARDVGQALGRNPVPLIVPCHRVLAAGGKAGGFSANGGITTKLRLLSIEGARTSAEPTLFEGDRSFALAVKPARRGAR